MKYYFTASVIMLSIITSLGIFGYLSKSYISDSASIYKTEIQIKTKEEQLAIEQKRLENLITQQGQRDYVVRRLEKELAATQNKIFDITSEIGELKSNRSELGIEIGPIRYIAELIYGDGQMDTVDKAVRIVIIALMLVFDPLAILLVIAANMQLKSLPKSRRKSKIEKWYEDLGMLKIDKNSVLDLSKIPGGPNRKD
jgi:hypothetical protein